MRHNPLAGRVPAGKGSMRTTTEDSTDATLRVSVGTSPGRVVAQDETISVGLMGDVRWGAGDPGMHSIVLLLTGGRRWTLAVPSGNHLEVAVLRTWSAVPLAKVRQGESTVLTGDCDLGVSTTDRDHRLQVRHLVEPPALPRRRARGTKMPPAGRVPDHWVLLCAERVRHGRAPALTPDMLAEALEVPAYSIRRNLSGDALFAIRALIGPRAAEFSGGRGLDHDKVVDWLVKTGTVTPADVVRSAERLGYELPKGFPGGLR
jgi:hypothetical protein